jgi:tetratricopeptide (TPR) repeat protein
VQLTLAANAAVSMHPWTFRLVNLLLHTAAALGVYLLGRELRLSWSAAAFAAALFVVHPVHTTVLNQIVDRADLMSAAAVVYGSWLVLRSSPATDGPRGSNGPPRGATLLLCGAFGLGLLAKENAIVLLPLAPLLELWRSRMRGGASGSALSTDARSDVAAGSRVAAPSVAVRERANRSSARPRSRPRAARAIRYASLLALAAGYLALRGAVLGTVARAAEHISPLDNIIAKPDAVLGADESFALARWGTPLAVVARAAQLLVWPAHLSWDYSYAAIEPVRSWAQPRLWIGAAIVAAACAGVALSWRRRGPAGAALLFMLVSYSVVSNTFILIGSSFAERYLYLPAVGACLLLACWWESLSGWCRSRRPGSRLVPQALLAALPLIAVGAGLWQTASRNADFTSMTELNQADVRTQPRSARLWCATAADALNAGDFAAALNRSEKALTIFRGYADAERIAGLACWRLRRPDDALEHLTRSVELGGAAHEGLHTAAGEILVEKGETGLAIALLESFVRHWSDSATAHNNLAWALLTAEPTRLRDPPRALTYARHAVQLAPDDPDCVDTCAVALAQVGREEEARALVRALLGRLPARDPRRAALEARWSAAPPRGAR